MTCPSAACVAVNNAARGGVCAVITGDIFHNPMAKMPKENKNAIRLTWNLLLRTNGIISHMLESMKNPAIWMFCASALFAQLPGTEVKIDSPQARVLFATEEPHHLNPMHEHKLNRVMVYLDSGRMIETMASGEKHPVDFKAGEARWSPAAGPHTSEFLADHPVRIVEIELKNANPPARAPSLLDPLKVDPKHYSLVFENNQTRVLRVRFGPHEAGVNHEHTLNHIVVYLTDQARGKAGEVKLDEPMTHTEQNPLDHAVERIAIDLK
jgi:hypothetical protein